jgi:hypothetical protein
MGRLPGERSCLSLVWAVLDRATGGWRGVTVTPAQARLLAGLRARVHPGAPGAPGGVDEAGLTGDESAPALGGQAQHEGSTEPAALPERPAAEEAPAEHAA